jgi:hypothetical protein
MLVVVLLAMLLALAALHLASARRILCTSRCFFVARHCRRTDCRTSSLVCIADRNA